MPYRCSVPNCKGNYSKFTKVTVFSFPKDPQVRAKWVQAIQRDKFTPTSSSKVCELHFDKELIERTTSYQTVTGEVLSVGLMVPRLIKGAIPNKQLPKCLDICKVKLQHSQTELESGETILDTEELLLKSKSERKKAKTEGLEIQNAETGGLERKGFQSSKSDIKKGDIKELLVNCKESEAKSGQLEIKKAEPGDSERSGKDHSEHYIKKADIEELSVKSKETEVKKVKSEGSEMRAETECPFKSEKSEGKKIESKESEVRSEKLEGKRVHTCEDSQIKATKTAGLKEKKARTELEEKTVRSEVELDRNIIGIPVGKRVQNDSEVEKFENKNSEIKLRVESNPNFNWNAAYKPEEKKVKTEIKTEPFYIYK